MLATELHQFLSYVFLYGASSIDILCGLRQSGSIKVTSVRSYIAQKNKQVGVIRIKSFSGTTGASVKEAFLDLKKKGAKSILFDLRSNPGGLLPGGVETASMFLEANKPVVYVVSNKGVFFH